MRDLRFIHVNNISIEVTNEKKKKNQRYGKSYHFKCVSSCLFCGVNKNDAIELYVNMTIECGIKIGY